MLIMNRETLQGLRPAHATASHGRWGGRKGVHRLSLQKAGKRGIMPADKVAYYNRIDIGIFLAFLELCMAHEEIAFERVLFSDNSDDEREETLVAKYKLEKM